MNRFYTFILSAILAVIAAGSLSAQSKTFKLGQWAEIQNSIIKELNKSYVDTLPVERLMKASINAMLEELDPYTIYIPEEDNEDFQMMLSNTYGGIGAIIKKGGLGTPIVISVIFFVIYYVISIPGEKMAKEGTMESVVGMWFPLVLLSPIAIYLLRKATNDTSLLDMDWYDVKLRKLRRSISKRLPWWLKRKKNR